MLDADGPAFGNVRRILRFHFSPMRSFHFIVPGIALVLIGWPLIVNRGLISGKATLAAASGLGLVVIGAVFGDLVITAANGLVATLIWLGTAFVARPEPENPLSAFKPLVDKIVRASLWVVGIGATVLAISDDLTLQSSMALTIDAAVVALSDDVTQQPSRAVSIGLTAAGVYLMTTMFYPQKQCRECRKYRNHGDLRYRPYTLNSAYFCRSCWRYSCNACLKRDRNWDWCSVCKSARIESMNRPQRPTLFAPSQKWAARRLNKGLWGPKQRA